LFRRTQYEWWELRVQILYILNNISHWRNPKAKTIRKILRAYKGE
jgi:hypothetical protein